MYIAGFSFFFFQQVSKLEKDFTASESKYHIMQAEMTVMEVLKEQTEEETKLYVNKGADGAQKSRRYSNKRNLVNLIY
jgi:hypothetical protein